MMCVEFHCTMILTDTLGCVLESFVTSVKNHLDDHHDHNIFDTIWTIVGFVGRAWYASHQAKRNSADNDTTGTIQDSTGQRLDELAVRVSVHPL